ncbi:putative cytochrome P450 [Tanacetum coccineum]
MGDANPIRTLGDYSKPSHEGLQEIPLSSPGKEERSDKNNVAIGDNIENPIGTETKMPAREAEKEDEAESEPNIKAGKKNNRVRKLKGKTFNLSPKGPVYDAILRKKITRKEDIRGNFEIPCNIGGLKHMNALVDQGSEVNVMPLSTYMKLTDERPAETDISLLLVSHSYIYYLGIAKDVLMEVAEHVYPMEFVILDIKEDEKRPFILGTPFLTTAKAVIKFDKGTITLRSGKSKISFHRIPESLRKIERGVKKDIEHIAPTLTVNRKFLIKNEEAFFKDAKDGVRIYPDGVASPAMLYLTRRCLEVLRKFHWMILGGRFYQLSHVSSPLLSKPEEY